MPALSAFWANHLLNRFIKDDPLAWEANPVGVVESCCSLQVFHELVRIVEVQWRSAHLMTKRIFTVGILGESSDPFPYSRKLLRYVFTSVTENSCHYVQFSSFHS